MRDEEEEEVERGRTKSSKDDDNSDRPDTSTPTGAHNQHGTMAEPRHSGYSVAGPGLCLLVPAMPEALLNASTVHDKKNSRHTVRSQPQAPLAAPTTTRAGPGLLQGAAPLHLAVLASPHAISSLLPWPTF